METLKLIAGIVMCIIALVLIWRQKPEDFQNDSFLGERESLFMFFLLVIGGLLIASHFISLD
jgi:hypothetical protein